MSKTISDLCRKKYWDDTLTASDHDVLELCDAFDAALAQVAALKLEHLEALEREAQMKVERDDFESEWATATEQVAALTKRVEELTTLIKQAMESARDENIDRYRGTDEPREFMLILWAAVNP